MMITIGLFQVKKPKKQKNKKRILWSPLTIIIKKPRCLPAFPSNKSDCCVLPSHWWGIWLTEFSCGMHAVLSATLLSAGSFYVMHEATLRNIRQLYMWQHCTGLVRKAFDCVCMPISLKLFSLLNRCTYCVHVLQILLVVCQLHAVQLLIKKVFSACVITKLAWSVVIESGLKLSQGYTVSLYKLN